MTRKPHLHILQRRELMSHLSLVESPVVAELFRITKSSKIQPAADLIFTQTYTDPEILAQLEGCHVPYVVHVQGDVWYELQEIHCVEPLLRQVNQVLSGARLVVCISDFLRQIAVREIPGVIITHLPGGFWGLDHTNTGIVPGRFRKTKTAEPKKSPYKSILMQINFTLPRKFAGIPLFFESISNMRSELGDWRFTCVGHVGTNKAQVHQWAAEYCFDYLPQSPNWPSLLASCDMYIHPSLYDTWGRSVAEAMCASVPVLAFNAGGVPEISDKIEFCDPYVTDDICDSLYRFHSDPEAWIETGKKLRKQAALLTEQHRSDYLRILNKVI